MHWAYTSSNFPNTSISWIRQFLSIRRKKYFQIWCSWERCRESPWNVGNGLITKNLTHKAHTSSYSRLRHEKGSCSFSFHRAETRVTSSDGAERGGEDVEWDLKWVSSKTIPRTEWKGFRSNAESFNESNFLTIGMTAGYFSKAS